ncbi:MAG: DUF2784 domain-containing protein [Thermoguttaceae bacterium]|nr:DUF2784 domain-containing protein [Thermoguttaceae bacterium]MDW8079131.1 DUF2784 domain-containing protein [Thermoguttaceae bacterium]
MKSFYFVLADFILFLHALYVGFVVFGYAAIVVGGLCGWSFVRNPTFRWVHLAAIGVVAVQGALGVLCPLTILEDYLRTLGGDQAETATFIARWLRRLIFVDVPLSTLNLVYVAFAFLVLATMIVLPPRRLERDKKWEKASPANELVS